MASVRALCCVLLTFTSLLVAVHAVDKDELDFKLLGMNRIYNRESASVDIIVRYEARVKPLVLVAANSWTPPMELEHQKGTVEFTIPDTEPSPVVYVWTEASLFYTLTLISHGPLSNERNVSSVALSTTPQRHVTYTRGHEQEPEITVTSRVVGNRRVSREELSYEVYVPTGSNNVLFRQHDFKNRHATFFAVLGENEPGGGNNAHAGNGGGGGDGSVSESGLLRMTEHVTEVDRVTYRLRLNSSVDDRGVLFLEQRLVFDCTGGCVLYEMVVSKALAYFREDLYAISDDAIVPYARYRHDMPGQLFVAFVGNNTNKTCYEGRSCVLMCEVFGDNPEADFGVLSHRGFEPFNDVAATSTMRSMRSWSFQLGYLAYSFVRFDPVTAEAAGEYACKAELAQAGIVKILTTTLQVLSQ